jgi:uncharacterized protein (TIGR00266 family)
VQTTIVGNPDYGELVVDLDAGERIRAVSGAMNWMSTDLGVKARLLGGMVRSFARKFLGGASLFVTEFTAARDGRRLSLAPTLPGAIRSVKLDGGPFWLTAGCFLAATPGIELRTKFYGFRAFLSGKGAFLIQATGTGEVWFTAYGALVERELDGELVVDTGHVCAFDPSVDYRIGGMGGVKQTLFSGEGLVLKFSGRGRLYLQTRNLGGTAGWLSPFCRG